MTAQQKLHRRAVARLAEIEALIDRLKEAGPCPLDGSNALKNIAERLRDLAARAST